MSELYDEGLGEGIELTPEALDIGKRADAYISEKTGITRSAVVRLIENGDALLSGKVFAKNYKIRLGDTFTLEIPEAEPYEAEPENIPLDIVYEDGDIVVVNKPKGMVVHPAPGNPTGTLVNALLYHCNSSLSGIGGVLRPGIVHRIDKDTEGLLVVAKNDFAHLFLANEIKEHKVSRIYYAIVHGNFKEDSGRVDAPIGRHPVDRKKMAVIKDSSAKSRNAVTHWSVVERFGKYTLVRCELETGRTHQIRVHMSYIGHPLLGDNVYGGGGTTFEAKHKRLISGQCLCATELRLTHPRTGEKMTFTAPMPKSFTALCDIMRIE